MVPPVRKNQNGERMLENNFGLIVAAALVIGVAVAVLFLLSGG